MEEFFYIGCQLDEIKLIDLVIRRYHTLDVMKVLSVEQFIKLVVMALEEDQKEMFRREWLAFIPVMAISGTFMSFQQYYETSTGANIDMRPAEEIIAEIDRKHAEARADGIRNL